MNWQKLHVAAGVAWAVAVGLFLVFGARYLWAAQAATVGKLLGFANVPYRILMLPVVDLSRGLPVYYQAGGQTFTIPVRYAALGGVEAIVIVVLLALAGFAIVCLRNVPLPFRAFVLLFLTLVVSTILYTSFISPIPPHTVNRLSIDWHYSGIVLLPLISLIFAFSVFPANGPLRIKFGWLFAALGYSVVWNVVRLSVVLATLYHLGGALFLLTHYLTGIYFDFLYIIAFYALAMSHLASHEVSEMGW